MSDVCRAFHRSSPRRRLSSKFFEPSPPLNPSEGNGPIPHVPTARRIARRQAMGRAVGPGRSPSKPALFHPPSTEVGRSVAFLLIAAEGVFALGGRRVLGAQISGSAHGRRISPKPVAETTRPRPAIVGEATSGQLAFIGSILYPGAGHFPQRICVEFERRSARNFFEIIASTETGPCPPAAAKAANRIADKMCFFSISRG